MQASGQLRTPAEGARDHVQHSWKVAAKKREDAAAEGVSVPELPQLPLQYTCAGEPDVAITFLVGLDDIARVVHWLATREQRCGAAHRTRDNPIICACLAALHRLHLIE